jgi:predicted lipoprotein with Yx(FWY)xxD motif
MLLVVAGCGGDDDVDMAADRATTSTVAEAGSDAGSGPTTPGSSDRPDDGAQVTVTSSPLGDILVDRDGRTLYLFTPDAQGDSTCVDACAQAWPPLLTVGPAVAGSGADESELGTVERDDGTVQVTYAGWPLYLFAGDADPGDISGQAQGGVWFVVSSDGQAVRAAVEGDGGSGY